MPRRGTHTSSQRTPALTPQGRQIGRPWYETPAILERLDEHARLALGLSDKDAKALIMQTQGVTEPVYYADKKHLLELAQMRAVRSASEYVAQVDAWLHETIREADAETRRPGMAHIATAMHQANKIRATEAYAKLHGVNKPVQTPADADIIIREYHIIPSPKVDIDAVLDAIDAESHLLPEPEGD